MKNILNVSNVQLFLIAIIPLLCISGPFLPDLVVTISSLIFLNYIIINKKFIYFRNRFFITFLIFYFILLTSSFFSDYIISFKTSVSYIRFGFLVLLIIYLNKNYQNFSYLCLQTLLIIFLILFIDASIQKFFGSNLFGFKPPYGRITSLFGDDIKMGGFISRMTPLLVSLLIYYKYNKSFILAFILISLYLCIISGERISILMLMIFLFFFMLLSKIKILNKFYILVTPLIFIIVLISFNETSKFRLFTQTLSQLNFTKEEPYVLFTKIENTDIILHRDTTIFPRVYHMYYETSKKIWMDNLFIGSGPRTYKHASANEKYLSISDHSGMNKWLQVYNDPFKSLSENQLNDIKDNFGLSPRYSYHHYTGISGANSHPHNIYLQLIAEIGLVGTTFVFAIFIYSIFRAFKGSETYHKVIFIGVLMNLFPIMFSGNFFNNWISILYFYPIGFLYLKK